MNCHRLFVFSIFLIFKFYFEVLSFGCVLPSLHPAVVLLLNKYSHCCYVISAVASRFFQASHYAHMDTGRKPRWHLGKCTGLCCKLVLTDLGPMPPSWAFFHKAN